MADDSEHVNGWLMMVEMQMADDSGHVGGCGWWTCGWLMIVSM